MFSLVVLGAIDVAASKAFYDATISALGGKPGGMDQDERVFYRHNGCSFMLTKPIYGTSFTAWVEQQLCPTLRPSDIV